MGVPSEAPLFSRVETSPFGKLDDRIEAFRIESVVKERFAQVAADNGKAPIEFLREIMRVIGYGPEAVKRMHCDRIDAVVKALGGRLGGETTSTSASWEEH